MTKLFAALLAATFLAGPAAGAEQPSKDAPSAARQDQAAGKGSQQPAAASKPRKAKKDPINSTKPLAPKTETKPSAEPSKPR